MRCLLLLVCLLVPATAAAAAPSASLDAPYVPAGERYVLLGKGWSLSNACDREVQVSRRLGHGILLGRAAIGDDGAFTFMRKIARTAKSGSRIVLDVTQFCGGVGQTRTVTVRVIRPARTCAGTIAVKGRAYILETWGGLSCDAGANAVGPFLDSDISPSGYDCALVDPKVGYHAYCRRLGSATRRVTARRIREV